MNYEQYKQKIRRFKRDDLLIQSSFLSWKAWNTENLDQNEIRNQIVIRGYAPRVAAISAATGNNFNRIMPSGTDVLELSHSFLLVKDNVSLPAFIEEEKERYRIACQSSELLRGYEIDFDVVEFASPASFIQRTLRSQWDSQSFSLRHVVRSWLIFKLLNSATNDLIENSLRQIVNLSGIDSIRSAIALFAMIEGKPLDYAKSFICIDGSNIESRIIDDYDIDHNTVKLVASRMSLSMEAMRTWHDEVILQPEVYKKYYPLPFYSNPLISAQEIETPFSVRNRDSFYLCPCPHMMLAGASTFIFRLLSENIHQLGGIDLNVEIGNAIEEYLQGALVSIFGYDRVTRINNRSVRNADFLIEIEECFIIVECKKTISNRIGRTIISPEDQVKVWEKLTEALIQCSSTRNNFSQRIDAAGKPVICIIVADENILGEDGVFAIMAEKSNILASLNIQQFEVISIDAFENVFSTHEHSEVITKCLRKWDSFRQTPTLGVFHSLLNTEYNSNREERFPHLHEAFDELFPLLTNPFS